MVTWDGTVKVLSFGVSCMGAFTCQASGKAPDVLHYVSPEQLRGDPVDGRSNIFSLGAILYEMATESQSFSRRRRGPGAARDCRIHAAGPDRSQPQDSSGAERSHHEGAVQGGGRSLSEWTGTGQRSGALQGKYGQGGRQEIGAARPGIERSAAKSSRSHRRRMSKSVTAKARPASAPSAPAQPAKAEVAAGFGKSSRRGCGMGKRGRRFHSRTGEAGQGRLKPSKSDRAEHVPGTRQRRRRNG